MRSRGALILGRSSDVGSGTTTSGGESSRPTSADFRQLQTMLSSAEALQAQMEQGSIIEGTVTEKGSKRFSVGVLESDEEAFSPKKPENSTSRIKRENPQRLSTGIKPLVRQGRSSTLVGGGAPYRVASNCAEFGEDGTGFRTDSARLAGWILVARPSGIDGQMDFRRRYVEVDMGELRVYKTESPTNVTVRGGSALDLNMSAQPSCPPSLKVSLNNQVILHIEATMDILRGLIDRFLTLGQSGNSSSSSVSTMNTVIMLPQREEAILVWNGDILSTVPKKKKKGISLSGLNLVTSEHHFSVSASAFHQLVITNKDRDSLVLTVPDPLLLMQWVGAINSCDSDPGARQRPERAVMAEALKALVLEEEASNSSDDEGGEKVQARGRSETVGVRGVFGVVSDHIPTQEEIKKEMMESLPDSLGGDLPSLRSMLADDLLRSFVYKWSLAQHSSENVRFWIACELLCKKQTAQEKSDALLSLCQNYIDPNGDFSINIGGLTRKKILKQVADAKGQGINALASLLPGIFDSPLAELARVMEFDLYPSLVVLMHQALQDRAAGAKKVPQPRRQLPPLSTKLQKKTPSASELLEDQDFLQELVSASTGKAQTCLLFIAVFRKFRSCEPNKRLNVAASAMRTYFDSNSAYSLESVVDPKKLRSLESQFEATRHTALPATLFDDVQADVILFVENMVVQKWQQQQEGSKSIGRSSSRKIAALFSRK